MKQKFFFVGLLLTVISNWIFSQTVDENFVPIVQRTAQIYSHAVQSDGKILISGDIVSVGSSVSGSIARLNKDGSLDESFSAIGLPSCPIDRIYTLGDTLILASSYQGYAWLLNKSGRLIFSRTDWLRAYFFGSKILAQKNNFTLALFDLHGQKDPSFEVTSYDGYINDIKIQDDNKLLIAGDFKKINDLQVNGIVRLNSNGSRDNSFNAGSGANLTITNLAVDSKNRILVCGYFDTFNSISALKGIIRLNSTGSIDTSFNLSGIDGLINLFVTDVAIAEDTLALIIGRNDDINRLFKIKADGSIDNDFAVSEFKTYSSSIKITNLDSLIAITGCFSYVNDVFQTGYCFVNSHGEVKTNVRSFIGSTPYIYGGYHQDDGKLLIYGDFITVNGKLRSNLARLNPNGSVDDFNPQLGTDYTIYKIVQIPGKRFIVSGYFPSYGDRRILKLNSDGSLDNSLMVDIPCSSNAVIDFIYKPLKNGFELIVGGDLTIVNSITKNYLFKIDSLGNLSNSFNPGNIVESIIRKIDTLNDGSLIIGGDGFIQILDANAVTSRFRKNGLKESIGSINTELKDTILAGGFYSNSPSVLYQIDPSGKIIDDHSLSITSNDGVIQDVLVLKNKNIFIGGRFTAFNSIEQQGFIKVNLDGNVIRDYILYLNGDRTFVYDLIKINEDSVYALGYYIGINGIPLTSVAKIRIAPLPSVASELTVNIDENVQFSDEFKLYPTIQSWDFGDGQTSDEQNPQHSYSTSGKYVVNMTSKNEYGTVVLVKSAVITVIPNTSTSLEEKLFDFDDDKVNIYPVPVNDIMTIYFSETEAYPAILEILNLEGKSLKMMKIDTNNTSVDLSDLNSAIYFVKVTTGKNTYFKKIQKL
jgi:uncharacterized delta-60 repeat protein